jgi:hypothetical protein
MNRYTWFAMTLTLELVGVSSSSDARGYRSTAHLGPYLKTVPATSRLLDWAHGLPRELRKDFVVHMRKQLRSRANNLDDLIREGLLTPAGIAGSFSLQSTRTGEWSEGNWTHFRVEVYNGGTNGGNLQRPGGSVDWMGLVADEYARNLERRGAQIGGLKILGSRQFELSFWVPTNRADEFR